jgi:hypothetical protein
MYVNGCIVRLCRVKSAPFFSIAERGSLPPEKKKNDEYEAGFEED